MLATLTLEYARESTKNQRRNSPLFQKGVLKEVPSLIHLEFIFLKDRHWSVDVNTTQHGARLLARVHLNLLQRWLAVHSQSLGSVTFGSYINTLSTAGAQAVGWL